MNKEIIATLTDENGETFTQEYTVERKFQVQGHDYLALIPKEDDDNVYLFDFKEENGDVVLLEIEDDDVFDAVALAYEKLLDQQGE